jgi:BASS family bile acid:Na+ symporter
MPWYARPAATLAWLGRQGTRAVAFSIFAGLALPPLAALFKPAFTASLFALLCLAFLRVDPAELRAHAARPGLVLAATAWIMIATPLACGLLLAGFGISAAPGLYLALIFQAIAPPVTSSPALAALMGLDGALALATFAVCAAAAPATTALFAALFLGPAAPVSALGLGLRLFALLAGAAAAAALVRRIAGQAWVERQAERIDGLSVIALFVFAVAVMDGVLAQAVARPVMVLGLVGLAFATSLGLAVLTAAVFARAGRSAALTLAVSAGLRNMGLMVAAAAGLVPDLTWLYVAIMQFPVYLLPHVVKRRLARDGKIGSRSEAGRGPGARR